MFAMGRKSLDRNKGPRDSAGTGPTPSPGRRLTSGWTIAYVAQALRAALVAGPLVMMAIAMAVALAVAAGSPAEAGVGARRAQAARSDWVPLGTTSSAPQTPALPKDHAASVLAHLEAVGSMDVFDCRSLSGRRRTVAHPRFAIRDPSIRYSVTKTVQGRRRVVRVETFPGQGWRHVSLFMMSPDGHRVDRVSRQTFREPKRETRREPKRESDLQARLHRHRDGRAKGADISPSLAASAPEAAAFVETCRPRPRQASL